MVSTLIRVAVLRFERRSMLGIRVLHVFMLPVAPGSISLQRSGARVIERSPWISATWKLILSVD